MRFLQSVADRSLQPALQRVAPDFGARLRSATMYAAARRVVQQRVSLSRRAFRRTGAMASLVHRRRALLRLSVSDHVDTGSAVRLDCRRDVPQEGFGFTKLRIMIFSC